MTVAYYSVMPNTSREQAQQVSDYVNEQVGTQAPAGGVYHAEGPLDDGSWWSFDVWDSEETAQQFYATILTPALQQANVQLGNQRTLAVHWQTNPPQGER